MTLIDDLNNLHKLTDDTKGVLKKNQNYEELGEVLKELTQCRLDEVPKLDEFYKLLEEKKIDLNYPKGPATTASNLAIEILKLFQEDKTVQAIKTGRNYSLLLESVPKFVEAYKNETRRGFNEFVGQQYSGLDLNTVETNAGSAPQNQEKLTNFRQVYTEFKDAIQTDEVDQAALSRIQVLGEKLETIYKNIDFNVPEKVKAFFSAVAEGGASLGLLNDEVKSYLKEKEIGSEFCIVKRKPPYEW